MLSLAVGMGCQPEEAEDLLPGHALSLAQVQARYQELEHQAAAARQGPSPLAIAWDYGVYKQISSGEALLFPLRSSGEGRLYVSGADTSRRLPVAYTAYAYAYQNAGKVELEIVQPVPTTSDERFTGFVTVSDWRGEVKRILHYRQGEYLGEGNQGAAAMPKGAAQVRDVTCTTTHYWFCTEVEGYGQSYTKCDYEGSRTNCRASDGGPGQPPADEYFDPGNSGGGGGDGGGLPPKEENLCRHPFEPNLYVPCNENTCPEGEVPDGDGGCMSLEEAWEEEVCTTQALDNNMCLANVWNKIKSTNAVSGIIVAFENSSWVKLCIDASHSGSNAVTSVNGSSVNINLNPNNINRSELSIARTFFHELIHAELYRKVLSGGQRVVPDNYPGIYDYYRRYVKNWQHEQMAAHYISTLAKSLSLFDDNAYSMA